MFKCAAFTGRVSLNGPSVLSSFIMGSNDLLTFISCLGSMRRGRRGTVPFLTCELQGHYFEPENNRENQHIPDTVQFYDNYVSGKVIIIMIMS